MLNGLLKYLQGEDVKPNWINSLRCELMQCHTLSPYFFLSLLT